MSPKKANVPESDIIVLNLTRTSVKRLLTFAHNMYKVESVICTGRYE